MPSPSLPAAATCASGAFATTTVGGATLIDTATVRAGTVGPLNYPSPVYTAPISQFDAGVYTFASPVLNVGLVDLEVLTLLTRGVCCRIEIREVAFNGKVSAVPEAATRALTGLGLAGAAQARRRRAD